MSMPLAIERPLDPHPPLLIQMLTEHIMTAGNTRERPNVRVHLREGRQLHIGRPPLAPRIA